MTFDSKGNGPVELVPPDDRWPAMAAAELERLRSILGDNFARGEHIGSTSIPGLAAKPILDLLPLVHRLEDLDRCQPALEAAGYEWRGEFGIPGRRLCLRTCPETGRRIANIHGFEVGAPEVARHLAFRDYLRSHPEERQAYEAVKRRAVELCPGNVFDYNDAKSEWIKACERRALEWNHGSSGSAG